MRRQKKFLSLFGAESRSLWAHQLTDISGLCVQRTRFIQEISKIPFPSGAAAMRFENSTRPRRGKSRKRIPNLILGWRAPHVSHFSSTSACSLAHFHWNHFYEFLLSQGAQASERRPEREEASPFLFTDLWPQESRRIKPKAKPARTRITFSCVFGVPFSGFRLFGWLFAFHERTSMTVQ